MGPRTISYILIDLIPIRLFGLPLITISFFITSIGYFFTELFSSRYVLRKTLNFRIVLWVLIFFVTISMIFNPVRDVIFESQGMIIFMMNIIIFSSASYSLGDKYNKLILGIFISIVFILSWVSFKLLTDPTSLPIGYSSGAGRYEGLFSSTPIMALVSISSYYIFISHEKKIQLLGLIGLIIAVVGLLLSGTMTTLFSSIISILIILYYNSKIKNKLYNLFNIAFFIFLILYSFSYLLDFYPNLNESIEYIFIRLSNLNSKNTGVTRLAEIGKELDLFMESPIFGHGYGILNQYVIPGFNKPLFGHNFITSLLVRLGIIGPTLIFIYWKNLFTRISFTNNSFSNQAVVIARSAFIGAILLTTFSNFSGYQTFGIYGSLVGIAIGTKFKSYLINL